MTNNHNFKNILLISTIMISSAFCQTATAVDNVIIKNQDPKDNLEQGKKKKSKRLAKAEAKNKSRCVAHKNKDIKANESKEFRERLRDNEETDKDVKPVPRKNKRKKKSRDTSVNKPNNTSISSAAKPKAAKKNTNKTSSQNAASTTSVNKPNNTPISSAAKPEDVKKKTNKTSSQNAASTASVNKPNNTSISSAAKPEDVKKNTNKTSSQNADSTASVNQPNNTSISSAAKPEDVKKKTNKTSSQNAASFTSNKPNNASIGSVEKPKAAEKTLETTKQSAKQSTQATQSVINNFQSNVGTVISDRMFNTMPEIGLAAGDESFFNEKGAWISGFVAKDAEKGENSYKSNSQGGTIGFDAKITDNITLGLAYSKLFAKIKPSDKDIDSFGISFDALSFYNQIEMDKFISESILSANKSKGKSKSKGFGAETSLSYVGKLNDNLILMPFASIGYMSNKSKAYKENTANIGSASSAFFNKKLGIKILSPMKVSESVKITPSLKASISHSSNVKGKNKRTVNIRFQDESYSQIISKNSSGVNYNLGAGILMQHDNIDLQATYNCSLKSKYSSHQGALKLRVNL